MLTEVFNRNLFTPYILLRADVVLLLKLKPYLLQGVPQQHPAPLWFDQEAENCTFQNKRSKIISKSLAASLFLLLLSKVGQMCNCLWVWNVVMFTLQDLASVLAAHCSIPLWNLFFNRSALCLLDRNLYIPGPFTLLQRLSVSLSTMSSRKEKSATLYMWMLSGSEAMDLSSFSSAFFTPKKQ